MKKKGKEERIDRVTVQFKNKTGYSSQTHLLEETHILTARALYSSSPVMSHLLGSVERERVAWLLCKLGGAYRG